MALPEGVNLYECLLPRRLLTVLTVKLRGSLWRLRGVTRRFPVHELLPCCVRRRVSLTIACGRQQEEMEHEAQRQRATPTSLLPEMDMGPYPLHRARVKQKKHSFTKMQKQDGSKLKPGPAAPMLLEPKSTAT